MRYPNVRVIFSHGGGTMPYLVERFTAAAKSPKFAAQFPQGFAGAAAKFFYDTAWTSNPVAMGALEQSCASVANCVWDRLSRAWHGRPRKGPQRVRSFQRQPA